MNDTKFTSVTIDNELLYIANLSNDGPDSFFGHGFTSQNVKDALKPVMNLGKTIKNGIKEIAPDEIEISMQLSAFIEEDKLLFGLVGAGAEAQIAVKYLWKKSDSENDSNNNN